MILLWILLGLAVAIGLWVMSAYNGLISLRNQTEEGWSDIDVQLKRRYDLIPNLINTVKGYAAHESKVFENVSAARSAAMGAKSPAEREQAENALTGTLKTLFAVSEAYPELKANEGFLKLQDELSDTENKIQAARRFYNGMVRDFNTRLQVFPTNMIGTRLGFQAKTFFEMNEAERETPKVQF